MPIQNVNASNNQYQVAGADTMKDQKVNKVDIQNSGNSSQNGDKLEISSAAEQLRSAAQTADSEPAQVPAQDTNTESKGYEAAAVPQERSIQEVRDEGVVENRSEQLRQRQQSEETAASDKNSEKRNSSLDLTV
ncbi:hypothetical protein ACFL6K_00795 [Candidatus Latescibacterota bacterium]